MLPQKRPGRATTVAGIIVICILAAGMAILFDFDSHSIRKFKEDVEVNIDFRDASMADPEDTTSAAVLQEMKNYLESQPFTHTVRIITKQEALKTASEAEGVNVEEYLGFNPLFSSITLQLKAEYVNTDSLEKISALASRNKYVSRVSWPAELIERVPGYARTTHIITASIALIFIIVIAYLVRYVFFQKKAHVVKKKERRSKTIK